MIDDFAHNPDKIAATLRTLHAFPGRLLLFFQPHGYGPLRTMKDALVAGLARDMAADDVLIMPDPVYHGGTTNREIGSGDIVEGVRAFGRNAEHVPERADCRRAPGRARPAGRPNRRHGRARRHAHRLRRGSADPSRKSLKERAGPKARPIAEMWTERFLV